MSIDIKDTIEKYSGIPAAILTGKTVEENISQAKTILNFKRDLEEQRPKSNAEKFEEWAAAAGVGMVTETKNDKALKAIEEIAEQERVKAGGYPYTPDYGEIKINADGRSTREQFEEWFSEKTAFNPFEAKNNINR